ncbi:tRNA (adenosine(37)-N6)-threonylcarbamoyltransferase complex ATPase subunit type 1 TsaE [Roseovarius spongiae]|uniref:tRNA threonylcarbamoyladenosine biosynthesis protein TsaE n=1 Tax=Roseovarius spongiae TaxID=2320272 RepID=A0A3A8B821_9RHOB|nr:tRNA (adenosine(37)-N6)-threonylcarbamoyltransferase complex ATPase subunit type 1 TsaE [Roseovarius spongiae]RKF13394.1 tRNA (adenosine(37)-N6)-threonylcarbamoyltransferase complex ATPase subunit type 1 TsaE [Roseovarius spongiae]
MTGTTLACTLYSPAQTCDVARALAPRLGAGDVILVSGDVGAGKTHFARCLIQARLIAPEDVPSPTYTLVQTYPVPDGEVWHADLYRVTGPSEIIELGLTDAFDAAICLVEWPDRLGDLAPENALWLDLAMTDRPEMRRMTLRWRDPRWASRLEGLCDG